MGEVVNLRRARKAKARAAKEATAVTNRAAFGRTKTKKYGADAARARLERHLDGVRREP